MSHWRSFPELPPKGEKFVAVFSDGSGARMYLRDDNGDFYGCESFELEDEEYFLEQFSLWALLPTNFMFWAEKAA